ncbi:MAG: DUF3795 domain-containing protein [Candidatus Bathyarchaeia archaeon]
MRHLRGLHEGDVEGKRRIIEAIFGEDADVRPEQITCGGCGGRLEIHWSPECGIMRCAHSKGLLTCSECPEFVCPELEAFYSMGYEKARRNALRQRSIGLEAWWKEQRAPRREAAAQREMGSIAF